jgi:hypothetical protein
MKQVAHVETMKAVQFLENKNGEILQVIPLNDNECFVARVNGFKDFEYSFEGPVPFSGDERLAFNKIREVNPAASLDGFRLVGKEFNRMARLSGTNDPEIVNTFRTSLKNCDELITFLSPDFLDDGRIVPLHSLDNLVRSGNIPRETCLAIVEIKCERNFDYIPSRSTYFIFYCRGKIMVVSHVVHGGPPLDCPGEEWEAKAYEASPQGDVCEFFAHNDGAISIELKTQPRGLLHAAFGESSLEHAIYSQATLKFSPVMVRNVNARYAFSPSEIPDRSDTVHLTEFQDCLKALHGTICHAVSY